MLKSARGIVISLVVLAIGASVAQVQAATTAKASAKKQALNKSATKRKAGSGKGVAKKASVASSGKLTKTVRIAHSRSQPVYPRFGYSPAESKAAPILTAGDMAGLHMTHDPLALKSNAALVVDQGSSQVLFEKNSNIALPIASLTKLMTALVVVEARQNMDEVLEVTSDDIDREKNSSSRLRVGSQMTRANMLHIALMSSENRAASALGRHYPGGLPAFVAAMNAKAKALGMTEAHFVDSTGLSSRNVASARDLARLVVAASKHPVIREYSTDSKYAVNAGRGYQLNYMNSNRLVMSPDWEIDLQKTGYISEAGRCLVMQTRIEGRPVVMVFLDSKGKYSRLADASRIRKWLQMSGPQALALTAANQS
ncbi:MAG TPA: D-alanyl-D-alanine endopeptidase [Noviherbaspirillum sp.]|nr:D-alanyl-D-alanine endopeptidase [Noviherbaspirillum sp.]